MKVRFFLRHGAMVEWPVPDPQNFSFTMLAKMVRADGCFMGPDIYIPADEIAMMGLDGSAAKVVHAPPAARQ